jgi:hypothetical protein
LNTSYSFHRQYIKKYLGSSKPTAIEITLSARNAVGNISKAFKEFQKVIVVYEDNDVKNKVADQAFLSLTVEQMEQVKCNIHNVNPFGIHRIKPLNFLSGTVKLNS